MVIDKLPFDPPDDPVQEARVGAMKRRGQNWFGGYVAADGHPAAEAGHWAAAAHEGRPRRDGDSRQAALYQELRRGALRALPPATRIDDIAEVRRFFAE